MTQYKEFGFFDKCWGVLVGLGVIGKAFITTPPPKTLQQRLAMLPTDKLTLGSPVDIYWNHHQVPFVNAQSKTDLAQTLGLIHGHLRLAQIEIMRYLGTGRISELIGPLGAEIDRSLRLLDIAKAVPEMIATMDSETREWTDNFLTGLNTAICHCPELPHECKVLGIQPKPWTMEDLMTFARINSADISWLVWLKLLKARRSMSTKDWRALWPTLVNADSPSAYAAQGRFSAEHVLALQTRSGSNSSGISGQRTESGYAAIVSDPHLPIAAPSPCLFIGAQAPGMHLVGAMMPGIPFFLLGRNQHIAWGATNLHAQSSDLFDVSGFTDEQIEEEWQTIQPRWSRPRKIKLRRTALGPMVSDGKLMRCDQAVSMRWQGHKASNEIGALLTIASAKSWDEFHDALTPFGVAGLNMIAVGGDGQRAGHCLAGHLPKRPNQAPEDVILPSSAAENWQDMANTKDMPVRVDTEQGFVVSANQRPENSDFPVGYFFSPFDRSERLTALYQQDRKLTFADFRNSQLDVLMPSALPLCQLFLCSIKDKQYPANLQSMIFLLQEWDGGYQAERVEPLAFELLLCEVVKQLQLMKTAKHYQTIWMAYSRLLDDLQEVATERLANAVIKGLKKLSKQLTHHSNWGDIHRLRFDHMFAHLPFIGRRYRFADVPASGGANTVNKTGHPLVSKKHKVSFGSCIRHISDMSDEDSNYFVMIGGQDGWIGSDNFADQVELWQAGQYIQLPMKLDTVKRLFTHKTVLLARE
ncbi:Penicillin acylase 2 precursor [Marinomonas spartinae]|uniref:Penicillin acylase 2 n=1 Tax=Marinomonas spartinae TaxID=1792290 RepID=A0A1A8TR16_9GAMM|nr:penicillin acylase family protein [Marinomonas spartinae]SBS29661.1 Penicillin acylase 2 precursor [Marinomonas spartinae]SBS36895.1 Penicillin acylase 2 precursor [Marinomonas spartinae]